MLLLASVTGTMHPIPLVETRLHVEAIEVTEALKRQHVSQAFCSALPVAYDARCGVSNVVFLTRLGGGAFGNDPVWIQEAIRYALDIVAPFDLDVRLVNYQKHR